MPSAAASTLPGYLGMKDRPYICVAQDRGGARSHYRGRGGGGGDVGVGSVGRPR
jgi:hypothetical protein